MQQLLTLFIIIGTNICMAQVGLQIGAISILKIEAQTEVVKTANPIPSLTEIFKAQNPITQTPKAYCYSDLAFFCKIEVELEKVSKLPVKFRLGDVQYVDYLEGKTDFYPR